MLFLEGLTFLLMRNFYLLKEFILIKNQKVLVCPKYIYIYIYIYIYHSRESVAHWYTIVILSPYSNRMVGSKQSFLTINRSSV